MFNNWTSFSLGDVAAAHRRRSSETYLVLVCDTDFKASCGVLPVGFWGLELTYSLSNMNECIHVYLQQ